MGYSKGDFFGMLYHSRDFYNVARFGITGVGTSALNENLKLAGERILELTNELVETTQGEEGLIEIEIPKTIVTVSVLEYTEMLLKYVRDNKGIFLSYQSTILNQIEALLAKTIYKIKYLK